MYYSLVYILFTVRACVYIHHDLAAVSLIIRLILCTKQLDASAGLIVYFFFYRFIPCTIDCPVLLIYCFVSVYHMYHN